MSSGSRARIGYGLAFVCLACFVACGPGFVNSNDVNGPGSQTTNSSSTTTGSGASTTCGVDAYSNYGQAFFTQNCDSCHMEKAVYSGITSDLNAIISSIQSGSMPSGSTLNANDKARVLAWLQCGAPQNPTASSTTTGGTTTGGSTTTGGTGTTCTSDTYSNYAQAFFSANCTSCHKAGGSALPDLTTLVSVNSDSASIGGQISQGLMPPAPATISSSDKQRIELWISCGLPQ